MVNQYDHLSKDPKANSLEKGNKKFIKNYIFTANKAVVFDLEFTSWPGSNERNWNLPNENREVIQIGAVKIETTGDMQEVDSFQILVRPLKNPILSDYIVKLTGITQKKVEREGIVFPLALSRFISFIGKYPINVLYNGGDKQVIEENCQIHNIPSSSIFTKSTNLRLYFSEVLGISRRDCISGMLPELFGLNNREKQHDALEDARSISQVLRFLHMERKAP